MNREQLTLDFGAVSACAPVWGFVKAQEEAQACSGCGLALTAGDLGHGRLLCGACRRRRERDLAAERDYAAGAPLCRRHCRCDRPIRLDDGRDLKCGRTP